MAVQTPAALSMQPSARSHAALEDLTIRKTRETVSEMPAAPILGADRVFLSASSRKNVDNNLNDRVSSLPMPGSFPLTGHESLLPPTPPRHSSETVRAVSSPERPFRSMQPNGAHKFARKGLQSPSNDPYTPPTPDATPPSTVSLNLQPTLAPSALSPSSRAESFKTAREDPVSSDGEDDYFLRYSGGAVKPLRQLRSGASLGLGFERDDDATPTPKRLQQSANVRGDVSAAMNRKANFDPESIPDREWDTNIMRNITVRRKKRPLTSHRQKEEDEERVVAREIMPKLVNGSSEDDETPEPLTPKHNHFVRGDDSSPRSNDRSKRLSTSSQTSTALEAFIVPSSPQRRRTLRHVSKNLSLRSDDGSSRPGSNHTSLVSDDHFSMSRLSHRLRVEDINRANGIVTPDNENITPTVQLKHHPERLSMRELSRLGENHGRRRASEGNPLSTSPRLRTASGAVIGRSHSVNHPSSTDLDRAGLSHLSTRMEPVNMNSDWQTNYMPRRSNSVSSQHELTRSATRRALKQLDARNSVVQEVQELQESQDLQEPRIPQEPGVPVLSMRRTSITISTPPAVSALIEMTESTETVTVPRSIVRHSRKDSLELPTLEQRSTTESIPRVSFDRSTVATHEMHRASNASSNLRADIEFATARHLQSTPFSQISEHEMGEATAINIYPHNNNSLLVVQQVARPSVVQKSSSDGEPPVPGWPSLTVQPATPPQQFSKPIANVDSPLKNPRQPPQPPQQTAQQTSLLIAPIINIHPATPDHEPDELTFTRIQNASLARTPPISRSNSLVQRARSSANAVMRPLIARSSTFRRSYYRRSRPPREHNPRDEPRGQASEALHPFWQPRGFWDEFSDSDSDDERRLPAGGDTSSLGEPKGFAKVLDRFGSVSGRRSIGEAKGRGFLLGNSLGLERAGTNKRTPLIVLPVGLGRRTSNRVLIPRRSEGSLRSSTVTAERIARASVESLRLAAARGNGASGKKWNPKNWQVQYVGVSGVKDMWARRQAERRRRALKERIGVRFNVEDGLVRED